VAGGRGRQDRPDGTGEDDRSGAGLHRCVFGHECSGQAIGFFDGTIIDLSRCPGNHTETIAVRRSRRALNCTGCGLGPLITTDQRGMPGRDKEDKLGSDIGAYERQSD